jgi:hypothetical protein
VNSGFALHITFFFFFFFSVCLIFHGSYVFVLLTVQF